MMMIAGARRYGLEPNKPFKTAGELVREGRLVPRDSNGRPMRLIELREVELRLKAREIEE